ncbi:MAG TPA: DUF952 domain-containing protein [Solirubrobacteraceae bacterium]|nr:DUF952 domain-containing protein [Solirubrobacteraceae bacterium]
MSAARGPDREAAGEPLFHIARAEDWARARRSGGYRVSTLGRTLEQEGFIHLSFARQVKTVADAFYRNAGELVLLRLDPRRLAAPVRVEAVAGSDERFPHLYGELNLDAVIEVGAYAPSSDGRYPPVDPDPAPRRHVGRE